ncbi:MAG: ATP synthase F1 subunit gamma [Acidobacteria bacterium]|nr:ATP synthase F1 subunit gamma [Acidobacteriota bacterium]
MPSLIDLRRRIRSVKSTQQITKAMKMIAASRLRKSQERVLGARPFAQQTLHVIRSLATRVDSSLHPLLAERDDARAGARVAAIVITADKGLCGGYNTNLLKAASQFLIDRQQQEVSLLLIGRKGREFFWRRGYRPVYEATNVLPRATYEDAQAIVKGPLGAFVAGELDGVYVIYNEFKSILQQRVIVEKLLPLPHLGEGEATTPVDYIYEPSPQALLDTLLPRFVEFEVYRALLEAGAAEHAARMTAMDAATRNSTEVINQLTLYMNKVRQAAITREIIEVVSGAEAL